MIRQQFLDTPAMLGDASSRRRGGLATSMGQTRMWCTEVIDRTDEIHPMLQRQRDAQAAKKFLTKAIRRHGGVPETITIDGSAANEAAIKRYNAAHGTAIVIRKTKYLNNIVEQDHRAVKRVTRPMFGVKGFDAAPSTCTGIELMHMLRKGQLTGGREQGRSAAEQFYALAA